MRTLHRNALFKALVLSQCALMTGGVLAQDEAPPSDPDRETVDLERLVVTGRRAADRLAIDDKRGADGQVDAIRADDVGRLPDQNVAEAVRRLPGITTVNDQGEGRYLAVRGISPDLLNVTLNGQTAPAPEPDGRQVKLDDIPSALIGAVTVAKTLTPDMDANAIAGQVNIETVSAFDRGRTFGSARAAYGYYDLNGEHPYEYDASLGGVFGADDQFGAVVAFNRSDRRIGSQNIQNPGDWIEVDGHWVPEGLELRQYDTHRRRTGAVANFDWKASDSASLFLRFLYSRYQDSETRDTFAVEFDDDALFPASATEGSFADAEAIRAIRTREETTSTFSASTGGEFKLGDHTLNVEATYSQADKRDPHRDEWGFVQEDVSGSYTLGSRTYSVTPDGDAVYDPALYEPDFYEPESRRAVEDLYQVRADYLIPIGSAGSDLQFGVKFIKRDKRNDENGRAWEYDDGDLTMADVSNASIGGIFGGRYRFGPLVGGPLADAYFGANPSEFEEDEDGTLSASLAADYEISEKITSAYVMTRLWFGDLSVIPGVRMERTVGDYSAHAFDLDEASLDQAFNVHGSRSYTDWFPGVNVRWDVGENLVLRAAATRAIGRPNYESLAPFVEIEGANSAEPEVTMGNPELEPLYSTNLDLSVEYYVGNRGLLAAAVFHKRIDNPIYEVTRTGQDGVFGGLELTNAEVGTWTNAERATVSGVEFNAQYELGFLPSPFDGFSVGANLTFVDSEAEGLPERTDKVPLLNQSDRVASAQLSYEKYGFSARLAYSYRSAAMLEVHEEDPEGDIYSDSLKQWDLRLGYAVNPRWTVFLEGSNLNDAAMRTYVGRRNRLGEREIYGWSARAGVQYSF
ncbi:TonB-dependent receptor [Luteimonas sp. SJ-92]|uniref:TonB-dependent receptor n=1 Tax=Luteimonas salinisoli TaxID=2752307 RepID=A0A853JCC3_9GAMM|nr:TonB-dependent receptor [Luteimonas salinisoli]NZA26881.1 TonB-dependent receptor [Luteimonas salinisoli]